MVQIKTTAAGLQEYIQVYASNLLGSATPAWSHLPLVTYNLAQPIDSLQFLSSGGASAHAILADHILKMFEGFSSIFYGVTSLT